MTGYRRRRSLPPLMAVVALAMACGGGGLSSAAEPETIWPGREWPAAEAAEVGLDAGRLEQARDYALSAGGSGMIVRRGRVVLRWGDQRQRYDIKSATKSFGATALGLAIKDGKLALDDRARKHHPTLGVPPESNAATGYLDEITIAHLATHTAGFEKRGGYEKLLFRPGSHWHYSDGGPNWLAECLTLTYQRDLQALMFERVFTPLGIAPADLRWRNNQYRQHELDGIARREFGAGIHANVEALSRIGYLYLREGRWRDTQILTPEFVRLATRPIDSVKGRPVWPGDPHTDASDRYGLLWWTNADGSLKQVPTDAYWAWGLYDSLIVVIPSLDLVAVRGGQSGKQWPRAAGADHYDVLKPFLEPIAAAASDTADEAAANGCPADDNAAGDRGTAPYPPSEVIAGIEWAPPETIVRLAPGSDNWPLTWGDDNQLYTAYGDGWGFEPKLPRKLSLGLARVSGDPPDIRGENLRSADAEQAGDGARGRKASGMLMVDGVLYMLARNADNAQLAWSSDRGASWTWADWKWTTSFGCPTFLNFGRDYAGPRDAFVYVYSLDGDSAYQAADRMVLARVAKNKIADRQAYEYFAGLDVDGAPRWSGQIERRQAVFEHAGRCYRSGVSYHGPLKRYLWCQTLPESRDRRGPRFQGGFGIYEAPEPWGPWRTVYFTEEWDVGPGESSNIPPKWISSDGRTLHLVFSGDDHFSVRRATLTLR